MDGAGPGWDGGEGDGRDSTDGRSSALDDEWTVPLASLPVPAFLVDEDARIVRANDRLATTTGRDAEDLAGRALESLVAAADAGRLIDLLAAATHGEASSVTVDLERADDRLVPHRVTVGPLRDADGDVVGVVGTAQDVEEWVAREATLEEKQARLERFASILSHDLRNPLAVAEGYLHLAREESDAPHLTEVESALDRMGELVEDLLTLAREGAPLEDPSAVDLAGVATDAWSGVSTGDASLVVLDDLGSVRGDRGQIRQLFENLYRNSVEHGDADTSGGAAADGRDPDPTGADAAESVSRPARARAGDFARGASRPDEEADQSGGTAEAASEHGVTVTVGPTADGFYVADDGPGLPANLDDPFRDGVTTKPGGTGLGLSIVERVATTHGWTVEAGTSTDGGARFDVRFDDGPQPMRADR